MQCIRRFANGWNAARGKPVAFALMVMLVSVLVAISSGGFVQQALADEIGWYQSLDKGRSPQGAYPDALAQPGEIANWEDQDGEGEFDSSSGDYEVTFRLRYPSVPFVEIPEEDLEKGVLMAGSARGLPEPSEETKGRNMLGCEGVEIEYPSTYENIVLPDPSGVIDPITEKPFTLTFTYAEPGSAGAANPYRYTVEWTKLSHDGVGYTMEGWAFLNYSGYRNVAFYVAEPGFGGGKNQASYRLHAGVMVADGQYESELVVPEVVEALEQDGRPYRFSGWYQDAIRISEAGFSSIIYANNFDVHGFYGAYERDFDIDVEYETVVYDGLPHYATATAPEDVVLSFAETDNPWSVVDEGDWQLEMPSIIDAGVDQWFVRGVAEDGTVVYQGFDMEVEKRGVIIEARSVEAVYGSDDVDFGEAGMAVEGTDSLNEEQRSAVNAILQDLDLSQARTYATPGYTDTGIKENEIATSKTIEEYERDFPNFSFTLIPADFIVKPASIAADAGYISIEIPTVFPYNGTEQKLEPILRRGNLPIVEGRDYSIVAYEGSTADAGIVTIKLQGRGNYGADGSVAEVSYTIAQRPVVVDIPSLEYPILYGDTKYLPTPEFSIEGDDLIPEQREALEDQLAFITQSKAVLDGDDQVGDRSLILADTVRQRMEEMTNFTFTVHEGSCTVDLGNESGTIFMDEYVSKTYDGKPLTAPTPRVLGPAWEGWPELQGYSFSYQKQDENGAWVDCALEDAAITDVGDLKVRVRAEKPNYVPVTMEMANRSCWLRVDRRPVNINAKQPPEKSTKVFGTADPEFENATVTVDVYETDDKDALARLQDYVEDVLGDIPVRRINVSGGEVPEEDASTNPYTWSLRPICDETALEADPALRNYSFWTTGAGFTITPADITTVNVSSMSDVIYNGDWQCQMPQLTDGNGAMLMDRKDYFIQSEPNDYECVGEKTLLLIGQGNYQGRLELGYTISPREVTVQLPSAEIAYGDPLPTSVGGPFGFVAKKADDEVLPEVLGSKIANVLERINASVLQGEYDHLGVYEGVVALDAYEQSYLESNFNYIFTVVPGNLTIVRGELPNANIYMESKEKVYDGTPLVAEARVMSPGCDSVEGFTYSYEYTDQFGEDGEPQGGTWQLWPEGEAPSLTNVGKIAVRARAMHDGYADVGMLDWERAVLEVTPCPVDIVLDPATPTMKTFIDPDPDFPDALMSRPANISSEDWDALQAGVDLRVSYKGSSSVGTRPLSISESANQINARFPNFTFTVASGTFIIVEADIASPPVNASIPESLIYTAEPVRLEPVISYECAGRVFTLREGTDFTVSYIGNTIEAGAVSYEVKGIGNFMGSFSGVCIIEMLPVTIRVSDVEVVYGDGLEDLAPAMVMVDGKPLEQCPMALQEAIEALGINLDIVRDGLPTALGTHEGVLTIAETADDLNCRQNNIEFAIEPGSLTVKPLDNSGVTLTVKGVSCMYTGEEVKPDIQLEVSEESSGDWSLEYSWAFVGGDWEIPEENPQWTEWAQADYRPIGVYKALVRVRAVCDGYEPAPMNRGREDSDYIVVDIAKRPVSLVGPNIQKVYGEEDPDFGDAIVEFGGDPITDEQREVMEGEIRRPLGLLEIKRVTGGSEDAGIYEDDLVLKNSLHNINHGISYPYPCSASYDFSVVPGTFTILQRNISSQGIHGVGFYAPLLYDRVFDADRDRSHPDLHLVHAISTGSGLTSSYELEEGVDFVAQWDGDGYNVGVNNLKLIATGKNYTGQITASYEILPCQVRVDADGVGQVHGKCYAESNPAFEDAKVEITSDFYDAGAKARLIEDLMKEGLDLTVVCPSIDERTIPGTYSDVVILAKTADELNIAHPNYRFEVVPTYFTVWEGSANVVVNLTGGQKIYDGDSLGVVGEMVWEGEPIEGFHLEYHVADQPGMWGDVWTTEPPSIKDVGTLYVQVRAACDYYFPVWGDWVELKVTPRKVVVDADQPEDKKWRYVGESLPVFDDATLTMDEQGLDERQRVALYKELEGINLSMYPYSGISAVGRYWLMPIYSADTYSKLYPNFTFEVRGTEFEIRANPSREVQKAAEGDEGSGGSGSASLKAGVVRIGSDA